MRSDRLRPSSSISGLMSEIVIVEAGELFICVLWSRSRNAMSPVPPAMSSIFHPCGCCVVVVVVEEEVVGGTERPGFMERTK